MGTIFDAIQLNTDQRPVYTTYELGHMIQNTREKTGMSITEFSKKYDIEEKLLLKIEEGKCCFSPKMYKVCGKILGKPTEELVAEYQDDIQSLLDTNETFHLANILFNEMILQKKINIKKGDVAI